jgi:hypothetical protein
MSSIVRIERGSYSRYFQVARAWLMAASASVSTNPREALSFIDAAIRELRVLRQAVKEGA